MSTKPLPRRRSLDTRADAKADIPAELKRLAKEFYFQNKIANAASNVASAARKALMAGMSDSKIKAFDVQATNSETAGMILLEVRIASGRCSSSVNMDKLRKLVNDDHKLMQFVQMSKTAVVDNFGTVTANQVSTTVPGVDNVQVSPKK